MNKNVWRPLDRPTSDERFRPVKEKYVLSKPWCRTDYGFIVVRSCCHAATRPLLFDRPFAIKFFRQPNDLLKQGDQFLGIPLQSCQ